MPNFTARISPADRCGISAGGIHRLSVRRTATIGQPDRPLERASTVRFDHLLGAHLLGALKIGPQVLSISEVNVFDFSGISFRIDVKQDPDAVLHRALDGNFLGTKQRYLVHSHGSCRLSGKCGAEVFSRREDGGDHIVKFGDLIPAKNFLHEFTRRRPNQQRIVRFNSSCSTNAANRHRLKLPIAAARDIPPCFRSGNTSRRTRQANRCQAALDSDELPDCRKIGEPKAAEIPCLCLFLVLISLPCVWRERTCSLNTALLPFRLVCPPDDSWVVARAASGQFRP